MIAAQVRAAELFALDSEGHQLTVKHDDGLYRHLSFRRPDTNCYWFDLVTWPGFLTIAGDMGSYTFARTADMLGFFLSGPGINPGYWAEKVQGETDVRVYDEALMRQHVEEDFRHYAEQHGWVLTAVVDLWDAIDDEVLPELYAEDLGHLAVGGFRFRAPRWDDEQLDELPTFSFYDSWDWSVRGYSHRFLWCCHAIRWGAEQYQAAAVAA
jgi:hypothetical protein